MLYNAFENKMRLKIYYVLLAYKHISTPEYCRVKIKESIKIIMSKQENDLHNFIKETKKEFLKLPAMRSFPRSCNN